MKPGPRLASGPGFPILQIAHAFETRAGAAKAKGAGALARFLLIPLLEQKGVPVRVQQRRGFQDQNDILTLGDAVAAVSAVTADEQEVVAVVLYMLRRETIRFLGAAPFLTCLTPPSVADRDMAARRACDAEHG